MSDLKYYLVIAVVVTATLVNIWPTLALSRRLRHRARTAEAHRLAQPAGHAVAQAIPSDVDDKKGEDTAEDHSIAEQLPQIATSKEGARPSEVEAGEVEAGEVEAGEVEAGEESVDMRSRAEGILRFPHSPLQIVLGTFEEEGHFNYAGTDLESARLITAGVSKDIEVLPQIPGKGLDENKGNMLIVGSPHRNPFTRKVLTHEATRLRVKCEFTIPLGEASEREFRELRVNNVVYGPEELKELRDAEEPPDTISDFALLAKMPNPFELTSTVLIVAGLHWIGTRGAAEFLAKTAEDLEEQVGDGYFAVVIYVEGKGTEEQVYFTKVQMVEGSLSEIEAPSEPLGE